jgi:non-canonical purine NTP pyrophosphatase (RdgB/HAM1 family)
LTKIFYITGNKYKFKIAKRYADELGFNLVQKQIDIKEIQSESIVEIARYKAKEAFKIFKKPLVVSDSGWKIPVLNGFPGPYMHYINNWFKPEDFLSLIKNKKNKSVILEHVICAISSKGTRIFKKDFKGKFIENPKGKGLSSDRIISLRKDGKTIAESDNNNENSKEDYDLWKGVYKWSQGL